MVMLLGQLAHNVIVWSRHWLSAAAPNIKKFGIVRIVRDLFQVSGLVFVNTANEIERIVLNQANAIVRHILPAFHLLLRPEDIPITMGKT